MLPVPLVVSVMSRENTSFVKNITLLSRMKRPIKYKRESLRICHNLLKT